MSTYHRDMLRYASVLLLVLSAAFGAETTVRPVLLDDWGQIHADMVADAHARAGQIQVVFIGDSITARWTRSPGEKAWAEHFAPLGALNLGIPADSTQHVLWRLQHGVLDGLKPKAVLLMIGTNNIGAGHDPESIAQGVWTIVAHVRTVLPTTRVLVQAIFPRSDKPGLNEQVAKVNALLARLDDGKAVTFIDFGARFLNADGRPDPAVFTDGLHPNKPEGFRIWSEAILPTVQAWVAAEPLAGVPVAASPFTAKDATPSTPAARNDFLDRHRRILAIPADARKRCRLLFLGDERMRAWDRVPNLFRTEYGGLAAQNISIGGSRPENMLWQLANGAVDGMQPALVVLHTQEALARNPEEQVVAGMRAVVADLRTRLPQSRILVLGAFPQGDRPDHPQRAKIARYNAQLAGLAEAGTVEVLDLGTAFLTADGTWSKGASPSHIDFTEAAYARWAEAQRAAIQRLTGP